MCDGSGGELFASLVEAITPPGDGGDLLATLLDAIGRALLSAPGSDKPDGFNMTS